MPNDDDDTGLDFDIEKDLTLEFVSVSDPQMYALAQMVKRMHYEDMRKLATDDFEADLISGAITKLQNALDRAGYAPR